HRVLPADVGSAPRRRPRSPRLVPREMNATRKDRVFETPWFSVSTVRLDDGQPYYMLDLPDYVSVIAVTADGRMIFVRQYRPVVGRDTIELPSGHVDAGESPEAAGRRELLEETGYVAGEMQLMGTLVPDVGRLANRMWCYFAPRVTPGDGA